MSGAAGGDDVLSEAEREALSDWWLTGSEGDLFNVVERILADRLRAGRAEGAREALEEAADEMWRIFLRLPHTPSPLGDYIQRRVVELRARAAAHATQETSGEGDFDYTEADLRPRDPDRYRHRGGA